MRMADLQPGWDVVTNDGRHFGTIRSVGQNYLTVSKSAFSGSVYVPASAIGNVDGERVQLHLSKNEADEAGWDEPPREADDLQTNPESDLHRHV
jgi:hypothetical protein